MPLKLVACAWFDVLGDGSNTVIAIDLTTDAVSFSAGLNREATKYADSSNLFTGRELSKGFKITSKNIPSAVLATVVDSGASASSTLSGAILTVTFSSALASGFASRVLVELAF